MRLRVNGMGSVEIYGNDGVRQYVELFDDFLRDFGETFSFAIRYGISGFMYENGASVGNPPGIQTLTYFGSDGSAFPTPSLGAWSKGDEVLAALPRLIVARDARNSVSTLPAATVATLGSELRALDTQVLPVSVPVAGSKI